jgi:hypothetical protein
MIRTRNTQASDRRRRGESLVKLILVVLAAPVVAFLLVSAVVLGGRTLFGESKPAEEFRPQAPATRSWQDRVAHLPAKAPPKQPGPKTPAPAVGPAEKKGPARATPSAATGAVVTAAEPAPARPETTPAVEPPPAKPIPAEPTGQPAELIVKAEPKVDPPVKPEPPAKPQPPARPATRPAPVQPRAPAFNPDDAVWVLDDFERGDASAWSVKPWANPAGLSVADGQLAVDLEPGRNDKSAVGYPLKADMSSRKKFVLDVNNETGKRVVVALAFMTGDASTYFETEGRSAAPGVNKDLTFDLESSRFKCAAASWQHNSRLANPDSVKGLCILIYGEGKGRVLLDNIREVAAEGP